MAPRPEAGLGSALFPIGAVAVVAGCSGGHIAQNGSFVPATSNAALTFAKAQLSFSFATQGQASARSAQGTTRAPQSIPADAQAVGISFIPTSGSTPLPEQTFTPPPGGWPSSVTVTVNAPVGTSDTMIVAAYEPFPASECSGLGGLLLTSVASQPQSKSRVQLSSSQVQANRAALAARIAQSTRLAQGAPPSGLYPLNGAVQQALAISANGLNSLSVSVAPIAYGAAVTVAGGAGFLSGYPGQWAPLESLAQSQGATFSATAYDICGATQPAFGNPIVLNGPAGIAFLPAAAPVTSGSSTTVTGTYPSNSTVGGLGSNGIYATPFYPVTATLASAFSNAVNLTPVNVTPDYFIFALDSGDSNLHVFDAMGGNELTNAGGLGIGTPQSSGRQPQSGRRTTFGAGARAPLGNRSTQAVRSALSARFAQQSRVAQGTRSGQATRRSQSFPGYGAVSAMAAANVSNCPGGNAAEVAVVGNTADYAGIDVVTVAQAGANRTVSGINPVQWNGYGTPAAVAFDASCNLYVGDNTGYLGVGSASSGVGSLQALPSIPGDGTVTSLAAGPSGMYVTYIDYNTYACYVGAFGFGTTSVTALGFSQSFAYYSFDALALAGGNVYLATTSAAYPTCYLDFFNLSGSLVAPATAVSVAPVSQNSTAQLVGTATGSTLYDATATGYLVSVSGGSETANQYVNGIAISQDSPTSTLWTSDNSTGYLLGYTLPNISTPTLGPIMPNGFSPGPLSIAP